MDEPLLETVMYKAKSHELVGNLEEKINALNHCFPIYGLGTILVEEGKNQTILSAEKGTMIAQIQPRDDVSEEQRKGYNGRITYLKFRGEGNLIDGIGMEVKGPNGFLENYLLQQR